jgi:hypothetical protein
MRYWIGVASREHVQRGIEGGFSQLCHGKSQPLRRMSVGDWLIYYSPTLRFGEKSPCQCFSAIGRVTGEDVYEVQMAPGFVPYRRDIRFYDAREVAIRPLLDSLGFIRNKQRWGYAFRYGHFGIDAADYERISDAMLGSGRDAIN